MESSEEEDDFLSHEWITPQSSIHSIYQSDTEKMIFRRGSKVWTEDKDSAWIEAEVVDVKDKLAVVATAIGKKITVPLGKLLPRDPDADHGGVDDMTKLTYLHEPGVLYNLARRYSLNEIYGSR